MVDDYEKSYYSESPGLIRNNVLVGLGGYLFLYSGHQRQFAYLTGEAVPNASDVRNFFDNISRRKHYCDKKGILFLHVVFPSKPVVMTEMIPMPMQEKVQSLFLSRYVSTLKSKLPDYVVYPLDTLNKLKSKLSVFRKLDTHMTNSGSLAVACEILHRLGLENELGEHFKESLVTNGGELARMLHSSKTVEELIIRPIVPVHAFNNREALHGNTNNIIILHNPFAITELRVLICGDSFIGELLQYFSKVFKDIIFIRGDTFQTDMVELFAPDVIITSNAERYLSSVRSDNESNSALFWNYGVGSEYKPDESFVSAYKAQLSYRYHHHTYLDWCLKIKARYVSIDGFGVGLINKQIEVIDQHALRFKSTGSDPFFTFSQTELVAGHYYILQVDLESEVNSVATLYYTETSSPDFAEARTLKEPILIGINKLVFNLNFSLLDKALRLDPLNCPGMFSIINISLVEIADSLSTSTI
jgi:hypothetical protein